MSLKNAQSIFGVLGFHNCEPFVAESVSSRHANEHLILGNDDTDAAWH